MKFAGYISSVLAMGSALMFAQIIPDELTRYLLYAIPGGIALLGWTIQLLSHLKVFKKWIADGVVLEVKKELEQIEGRVATKAVEEVWNRLDTIKMFTKGRDETSKK